MKNVQKIILTSLLLCFTGCTFVEDIHKKSEEISDKYTQVKQNTLDTITDIQNKIDETKKNIEEKKAEFDQKIQDIKDAQAAFDKIFQTTGGEDGPSTEESKKLEELEAKIKQLEAEKLEVSEEISEETAEIKTLEKAGELKEEK